MVIAIVARGGTLTRRLYQYGKPTVTGKAFISKFPPQHRQTVRTILKGSEVAFTGGLVADILKDLNDDGTPNIDYGKVPKRSKFTSRKFDKTRNRRRRNSSANRCYKHNTNMCRCTER